MPSDLSLDEHVRNVQYSVSNRKMKIVLFVYILRNVMNDISLCLQRMAVGNVQSFKTCA